MAKIWQISDGRSYVVNGDPGTTITYTNSTSNGTAAGKQAASIPAGATSVTFPSNGAEVEISSDTATIDQVFNAAAAGSGSSSGGSGSAGGVTFQVVDTLPDQGAAGVIYLVKVSETGDDKFEEWIWVDSAWESIGTTAVDPTTYAKLVGGNTFEGNQVINGDLTVTGDVSGVTESNYNVVETTETTITPTGGTWVRYTGTATALTVVEPGWDGEAEISYLETATPVDLQGVTWSPAKPILTGNGPFVYTLVHSREGEVLAGAYGYSTPTAEAIQAVAPIAWNNNETHPTANSIHSVALGNNAKASGWASTALGTSSNAEQGSTIAIGHTAQALGKSSIAIGNGTLNERAHSITLGDYTKVIKTGNGEYDGACAITIGAQFSDTEGSHLCQTQGTGSITIGAGANTLNNGSTESSNSVTIGCKALNQGADSVVIGAGAKKEAGYKSVSIGAAAANKAELTTNLGYNSKGNQACTVAIGAGADGGWDGVSVGYASTSGGNGAIAIGYTAKATANRSVAIGRQATVSDYGATVIRSTAEDGTYTQLYFSGANTPLANTYEGGEAMMGYVVMQKGADGKVAPVAAGTQKLSVLFPNNSGFQPAMLSLDDDMTLPKVFHPSDLDMPTEEPSEPEEYEPLPVYPIVEPEVPEIVETTVE